MSGLLEQPVAGGAVLPRVDANLHSLPALVRDATVHDVVTVEVDPLDSQTVPEGYHG
jgi:hypothetical protein